MAEQKLNINIGATNRTGGVFVNLQRDIKRLKESVGEGSGIGGLLAITRGAGAAAGVVAATRSVTSLVEAFVEVRDAIDEGGDAFAAFENVMKRTPLINIIQGFGAAINEAFTGNQAAIRRLTEESRAANAGVDFGQGLLNRIRGRDQANAIGRGDLNATLVQANEYANTQRQAFKTLREEIKLTTEQATMLSKLLEKDIVGQQAQIIGRGALEPLLKGIGKIITPEAIKRYQDAQKPTIFGFRNPFAGSEDDRRRQEEEAVRRRSVRGSLLDGLRGRLSALRNERMATRDALAGGVTANSDIGISGVKSAGLDALSKPSSEESKLAAAIKKLDEQQEKRDQKSQTTLEEMLREIKRLFNLDLPPDLRRI